MLVVLAALLFSIHLICVHIASIAPLVAIWFDWKEGGGNELAGRVGKRLLLQSVGFLLLGGVLGLLLGWLVWSPEFHQALQRLSSKVFYGVWELLFSLVLVLLCWFWQSRRPGGSAARWGRSFLLVLAGTNLIYHFPVLFAVIRRVAEGAVAGEAALTSAQFREQLVQGDILAKLLHFTLASAAVCGAWLLMMAERENPEDSKQVIRWGARFSLNAVLLQFPAGFWLLTKLSRTAQNQLLGGNLLAMGMMGVSLGLAFWLLHELAELAGGRLARGRRAVLLMGLIVVAMSAVSRCL